MRQHGYRSHAQAAAHAEIMKRDSRNYLESLGIRPAPPARRAGECPASGYPVFKGSEMVFFRDLPEPILSKAADYFVRLEKESRCAQCGAPLDSGGCLVDDSHTETTQALQLALKLGINPYTNGAAAQIMDRMEAQA